LLEQQPFGQLVASQTHCPPEQRWPAPQGPPVAPQTQAPPVEQLSVVSGSQLAHSPPPMPQALVERAAH